MIDNEIVADAIEYILENIGDGIGLEEVANHCHMSVSYFSKIFKEQTGQSVYAFIKRIKMEQSAMRLKMETGRDITEIGEDYGYSASNYSTAFSSYHKKSPSVFRDEVAVDEEAMKRIFQAIDEKIRIEVRKEYEIMYERTIGSYSGLAKNWDRFIENHKDDIDEDTVFFERTYDDPSITQEDQCMYDIGMTSKHLERYKNTCTLPGGKYVVYPFKGTLEEIYGLNQKLIGIWFPIKQLVIDERYAYDQYYKVSDEYLEFDICIPIK